MAEGWVKLHRQFTEWEWYGDTNMVRLFLHLLLIANHKDKKWRGKFIKRGQTATGLNRLCDALNMSQQSVRTCLKRLENTGEINKQSNNQFSVITICNYEKYQAQENESNKPANKPTTNDQQATNNKQECKNEKNEKNKPIYDDLFLSFWSSYPNKKAKPTAKKAYLKVKDCHDEIMEGLERHKEVEWKNKPSQFIPHPATWLNARRWEDEINSNEVGENDDKYDFLFAKHETA